MLTVTQPRSIGTPVSAGPSIAIARAPTLDHRDIQSIISTATTPELVPKTIATTTTHETIFADAGKTPTVFWRVAKPSDIQMVTNVITRSSRFTTTTTTRQEVEGWFRWQARQSRSMYLFFSRKDPSKLVAVCSVDFVDEEGMDLNVAALTTATGSLNTLYLDQDYYYYSTEAMSQIWNILYFQARSSGLLNLTVRAQHKSINQVMANVLDFQPFKNHYATNSACDICYYRRSI